MWSQANILYDMIQIEYKHNCINISYDTFGLSHAIHHMIIIRQDKSWDDKEILYQFITIEYNISYGYNWNLYIIWLQSIIIYRLLIHHSIIINSDTSLDIYGLVYTT